MRSLNPKWMCFTLAYYGANAVWQGYMSLYYRSLGFAEGQIGLIGAASALCAFLVQPLWGALGDRTSKTHRLLAALAVTAALTLPVALAVQGFVLQLLAAALFYGFYCALLPMGDSILLQALNREKLNFGPYRLAGAAAFALSGAAFGWLLGKTSPRSVVWTGTALLAVAAACALLLPRSERKNGSRRGFTTLLQDRELMLLLAFMLVVQTTMGYFYTFFANHFSALRGASEGLLGLGYALSSLSEIPYLLLSDRIYRKFGAARPMCIAAAVLTLRWLLLGISGSAAVAAASQLLHGGGFIVMSVSMAKHIAEHVPPDLQASGQMLLSMASFGLARVAGNLGGGFLAERIGGDTTFLLCAGVCIAALCAFARRSFRSRA